MSTAASGIVASSHSLASEAGAALLRSGGNAIDAAAAIQFALNVVEPLASGIGGGAFMLIRLARGDTLVLDSRERAPAAATADLFLGPDGRPIPWGARCASGRAVGVPGTLMGLSVALARWGSHSLADALRPAIGLAEAGFRVSPFMAHRLKQNVEKLKADPASAAVYLPGDQPLREGDRLAQPDLARTLRLLAERGPEVLYGGEVARALVAAVQARDGRLTLDDLTSYAVEERRPLVGSYRGLGVATVPLPGAGVALLQALALLEPFDLAALGPLSAARAHLELQAMRLALLDRAAWVADPGAAPLPLDGLLDADYVAARRSLIETGRLTVPPSAGRPRPESPEPEGAGGAEVGQTTHFVVRDRWGNLVCCTSTIESFFGCGITVPGYGFLLNNEMTDFDAEPGGVNEVRPFARPASSMAPSLLLREDQPWLALGSPGGPTIVAAVLQVILRLMDDGMPLEEAINAPRCYAGRFPTLTWEQDLPPETLEGLRQLGHRPSERPTTIGSVQALLQLDSGDWIGGADPRRNGSVIVV